MDVLRQVTGRDGLSDSHRPLQRLSEAGEGGDVDDGHALGGAVANADGHLFQRISQNIDFARRLAPGAQGAWRRR